MLGQSWFTKLGNTVKVGTEWEPSASTPTHRTDSRQPVSACLYTFFPCHLSWYLLMRPEALQHHLLCQALHHLSCNQKVWLGRTVGNNILQLDFKTRACEDQSYRSVSYPILGLIPNIAHKKERKGKGKNQKHRKCYTMSCYSVTMTPTHAEV